MEILSKEVIEKTFIIRINDLKRAIKDANQEQIKRMFEHKLDEVEYLYGLMI